jgi:serine-type D-Ala-D-Ala carboxypeptidase/endopeptidase (penicillin-binding protein 4)
MILSRRTRSALFFGGLVVALLFISYFFIIPLIKARNFSHFIKILEARDDFRGSTFAAAARYEGSTKHLFSYQGDALVHPGSNFKLFTAAASLHHLGPDYTFHTKLYVLDDPHPKKSLVLVGSGDPTFDREDFGGFVEAVRSYLKQNKATIGTIYFDDRAFTGEPYGPGWLEEWKTEHFGVPITALQIADNLLSIRGGNRNGTFAITTAPLENYSPLVDSMTYFTDPDARKTPVTAHMDENGNVYLKGDTMVALPFDTSAVMRNPSEMTATVFQQMLAEAKLIDSRVPVLSFTGELSGELIHDYTSPDLKTIVFELLKFSKNNYAETLIRTLGKEVGGEGSQAAGVHVLKKFLDEVGIDETQVAAFDGSGMSPMTRATSDAFLTLFHYIDRQRWAEAFWQALPESKIDGTLRSRFEYAGLEETVIGKTGTHIGSASLSGKILREEKKNILFSVHIYGHRFTTQESVLQVNPLIDRIVALLAKQF